LIRGKKEKSSSKGILVILAIWLNGKFRASLPSRKNTSKLAKGNNRAPKKNGRMARLSESEMGLMRGATASGTVGAKKAPEGAAGTLFPR
jgi:hypothetical protein